MCLGVPGKIIAIEVGKNWLERKAKVDFGGVFKAISLVCTPEAEVGQYVLVHAGLAISIIDEAEAGRIFAELKIEFNQSE